MKIENIDTQRAVMIVAEIGNNHEGNPEIAAKMIEAAAHAGADAVKFQTFVPELYSHRGDRERLERLHSFRLSEDNYRELQRHSNSLGVTFFSTPFDLESLSFLSSFAPAIKISSGDNNFFALLEKAADTGKPLILSTGLADLGDLRIAVGTIERRWRRAGHAPGLAILHCVASYPVPESDANIAAIAELKRHFGDHTIGYSDHTLGTQGALMAVALGARVIEKHFTLDKAYSDFRDHQLSVDPEEMVELVRAIRSAEKMLGDGCKEPRPSEADPIPFRRSIAAGRPLPAGTMIQWSDITWVRPGTGFAPGEERLVLGHRAKRDLKTGEILATEDIE